MDDPCHERWISWANFHDNDCLEGKNLQTRKIRTFGLGNDFQFVALRLKVPWATFLNCFVYKCPCGVFFLATEVPSMNNVHTKLSISSTTRPQDLCCGEYTSYAKGSTGSCKGSARTVIVFGSQHFAGKMV